MLKEVKQEQHDSITTQFVSDLYFEHPRRPRGGQSGREKRRDTRPDWPPLGLWGWRGEWREKKISPSLFLFIYFFQLTCLCPIPTSWTPGTVPQPHPFPRARPYLDKLMSCQPRSQGSLLPAELRRARRRHPRRPRGGQSGREKSAAKREEKRIFSEAI